MVAILPAAPTAGDSFTTFPGVATAFFGALRTMVIEANALTETYATPLSTMPALPSDGSLSFASQADTFVADLPDLVNDVNGMIAELSLPVADVTDLPATPSRGGDAANFGTEGPAFLAALPTLRTELNAFIAALNAFNPNSTSFDATLVKFDSTAHSWDGR